ncbi:putative Queuine tRNA-ribosyltransferase-like protein [Mollisia scopiformis]|uniref:Queuine tRNA-ribosyltransferase accessory subunit 2 n=1 Tax=Mollisia scopiformis TaxID=149040 RepID=A0A194XCY0_MOLSC|nr:putative Queuine tRNA-ribosyltransferase-like protein [Mollisia scopiformis]KUJ17612.1 putative Queuine tRNA-ribosyltransferase-like protein [Mollisia scopiformis]
MASEKGSKLLFEVLGNVDTSNAGPRLGRIAIPGRKDFETPNFFAITSRGVTPHMTPDVVAAHTQFGGVHMALEDFIEKARKGTPPILTCPGPSILHRFTALPRSLVTLLAPRRSPAVTAPVGNSNTAVSIFTSTGFQSVSSKAYVSYMKTLRPDIAISLADVPYGSLPGTKRVAKMGDRTQLWLSELVNEMPEEQAVFAPILPIDFLDQSEYINYVADELADTVSGLAFYDSNVLPDIPATTTIVKLPRLSLDEPSSPAHILRQISLGMDIFTIPFIGFATDAGIALTFRFPRPLPSAETQTTNGTTLLPLGIDMWPSSHAHSLTPLSPSCTCYTCTSHHKAYIQHLLSAKEMLGWTLIQIHNHHIISTFFSSVRESIKNGAFERDCEEFARAYESELPEKSGQGPRVRGYHFKSEGPGEEKKNRAAWGNLGGEKQVGGELVPDEGADELEGKGFAEKIEA